MEKFICKTCKKSSGLGIDILNIHICDDCLNSISRLKVGDTNYDHYKDIIGLAWRDYERLKAN